MSSSFGVDTSGAFGGVGQALSSNPFGGSNLNVGGFTGAVPGYGGSSALGGILGNVGRIAGGIFDIFNTSGGSVAGAGALNADFIKESTKQLKEEQKRYLGEILDTFDRIEKTSGLTGPEAVRRYNEVFKNYMDKAYTQGREDLDADQALGGQYYDRLGDALALSQGYSLLRNPVYEQAYKTPDAVAPVDVTSIKDVMTLDASDPEMFKKFSYSQPESQALIQGRPDAIAQYANFFASKPSQDLMKYTV